VLRSQQPTGASPVPGALASAPTFSVLIPAYGTEAYIAAAIESVLAQSRTDWELVVVDDGSPDRLADVVARYLSDSRIRLIRQRNAGVAAALNRAAAASKAPYLVKLDSDDFLLAGYLQAVASVLDARPDVGVVSCDAFVVDEACGRIQRRTYRCAFPRDIHCQPHRLARLLEQNFILAIATIRRTMFTAVGGFDDDPRVIEDWDLWLRLVAAGVEIEILERPLAVYRRRFPSVSRDETGAHRVGPRVEYTLQKAIRGLELDPTERAAAERSLSRHRALDRMGGARRALLHGDAAAARRLAREALALQPSLRAAAVFAGLWLAPGGLRHLHTWKGSVLGTLSKRRLVGSPRGPATSATDAARRLGES